MDYYEWLVVKDDKTWTYIFNDVDLVRKNSVLFNVLLKWTYYESFFGSKHFGFQIKKIYINIDSIRYIQRWDIWWWDYVRFWWLDFIIREEKITSYRYNIFYYYIFFLSSPVCPVIQLGQLGLAIGTVDINIDNFFNIQGWDCFDK